jgi:RNA recognition motif-containing protein
MNIYIGNLSYNVREKDLERILQEYGAVASVRIIKDHNTQKSKGFGFCEMERDEDARKAIEKLNGTELSGRTLIVKEALPKN